MALRQDNDTTRVCGTKASYSSAWLFSWRHETRKKQYPNVFSGLACLKALKLKEDAKPNVCTSAIKWQGQRRDPENGENIIMLIKEVTEWCAGKAVAPKAREKMRIYFDMIHLNEYICWEGHTPAKLAGPTVFTKLDAMAGFWQIPFHPESMPLTTCITPFGEIQLEKTAVRSKAVDKVGRDSVSCWWHLMAIWWLMASPNTQQQVPICSRQGHVPGPHCRCAGHRGKPKQNQGNSRDAKRCGCEKVCGHGKGKFSPQVAELIQHELLMQTDTDWVWGIA